MLKLNKSKNEYQNSTKTNRVCLPHQADTIKKYLAISYNWWVYLKHIDGELVFNKHRYSPTTGKHQRECLNLLQELGIKIDRFVNQRESL